MAIAKMLDLSTSVLPSLESPDFGGHRFVEHDYGWIVFVSSDSPELTPEWLAPIMAYAEREDCILINFDRDAATVYLGLAYDPNERLPSIEN